MISRRKQASKQILPKNELQNFCQMSDHVQLSKFSSVVYKFWLAVETLTKPDKTCVYCKGTFPVSAFRATPNHKKARPIFYRGKWHVPVDDKCLCCSRERWNVWNDVRTCALEVSHA